jgi:hypothetical protein
MKKDDPGLSGFIATPAATLPRAAPAKLLPEAAALRFCWPPLPVLFDAGEPTPALLEWRRACDAPGMCWLVDSDSRFFWPAAPGAMAKLSPKLNDGPSP